MKFEIDVKRASTGQVVTETYTKNVDDAQAYAKDLVENFNNTLRPGESPRARPGRQRTRA